MSWRKEPFREHYLRAIGGINGRNAYVAYLNKTDRLVDGLDEQIAAAGGDAVLDLLAAHPVESFGDERRRGNLRSATRAYLRFIGESLVNPISYAPAPPPTVISTVQSAPTMEALRAIVREAQSLASRYYLLTGKPLGVTGEVAEVEAADKLGLLLLDARSPGHDATREGGSFRVQIKGRAVAATDRYRGRCPSIKGEAFDSVVLVLLDHATYEPLEMWEAPRDAVLARIAAPGGKARNERRSLAITQFKSIATRAWP